MKRNRKRESDGVEAERFKCGISSLGGLTALELVLCNMTKG